ATIEAVEAARAGELGGLKERNTILEGQIAALESATVAKDSEVAKLTQDLSSLQLSCDELSIKASTLEFKKDKLVGQTTCSELCDEVSGYKLFKEQVEAMQDEQVKALSNCVVGIDSDLIEMALHMDEEFNPCYLTTIAERRGRKNFEGKCAMQAGLLKEKYVEIASLKAQLSLKGVESTEAIHLCGQIATIEAVEAARAGELGGLKERNTILEGQIAALESATVAKDSEVAKLTQDLSSLQLSCDELSIKASTLEFKKDKLVGQHGRSQMINHTMTDTRVIQSRIIGNIPLGNICLVKGLRVQILRHKKRVYGKLRFSKMRRTRNICVGLTHRGGIHKKSMVNRLRAGPKCCSKNVRYDCSSNGRSQYRRIRNKIPDKGRNFIISSIASSTTWLTVNSSSETSPSLTGNRYHIKDIIQAKSDKIEHKMKSVEKSKVNLSQQKVNPDKVKATKSNKSKEIQLQGLKLPNLQTYTTRTEVAIAENK
nr:hypothetical protein [Tanacetum cinerariifolium]